MFILVLLPALGISANEPLSESELLDRAVQACYAKYTRQVKYDEYISEADERLCQTIFDLRKSKNKNECNDTTRVPVQHIFDEKLSEAFEHCVALHQLNREMTEQEKQICEKILYIMYSKLKEQYFYAATRSEQEQYLESKEKTAQAPA